MFKECLRGVELNGVSQSSHMDQRISELSGQVAVRQGGRETGR